MTPLALALVILAAGAHVTWNYLAKSSRDPLVFTWSFTAVASVLYLPLALATALRSPVPSEGWPFVAGTVALHVAYFYALSAAYRSGDLSLVYPVARGTGIALVPIVGVLVLGERVSPVGVVGIAAIVLGVLGAHGADLLALGPGQALAKPGIRLALLTGVTIAGYSAWDKAGVALVAPALYNYFLFLGQAITFAPLVLLRRRALLEADWRQRRLEIFAAALLSPLAYLLVLIAMTISPVSYVAPAREVAVVLGALVGVLVLKDPHPRSRVAGATLVTLGVAALALAG